MNLIEKVTSGIVELSLEYDTDDDVRNIYSAMMDVNIELGKIMKEIREQERHES